MSTPPGKPVDPRRTLRSCETLTSRVSASEPTFFRDENQPVRSPYAPKARTSVRPPSTASARERPRIHCGRPTRRRRARAPLLRRAGLGVPPRASAPAPEQPRGHDPERHEPSGTLTRPPSGMLFPPRSGTLFHRGSACARYRWASLCAPMTGPAGGAFLRRLFGEPEVPDRPPSSGIAPRRATPTHSEAALQPAAARRQPRRAARSSNGAGRDHERARPRAARGQPALAAAPGNRHPALARRASVAPPGARPTRRTRCRPRAPSGPASCTGRRCRSSRSGWRRPRRRAAMCGRRWHPDGLRRGAVLVLLLRHRPRRRRQDGPAPEPRAGLGHSPVVAPPARPERCPGGWPPRHPRPPTSPGRRPRARLRRPAPRRPSRSGHAIPEGEAVAMLPPDPAAVLPSQAGDQPPIFSECLACARSRRRSSC